MKEVSIVLRFLKIKNKFRMGVGCTETPLESSAYQIIETRHLTLPALCVWVQIVVLDFRVNNIAFVVPLLIGKVFREDRVWLFTTTKSKKKNNNKNKISRTLIYILRNHYYLCWFMYVYRLYIYILIYRNGCFIYIGAYQMPLLEIND